MTSRQAPGNVAGVKPDWSQEEQDELAAQTAIIKEGVSPMVDQGPAKAARAMSAAMTNFGPAAERNVDPNAYRPTGRGREYQGAVDAGLRQAVNDKSSPTMLNRFNTHGANASEVRSAGDPTHYDTPRVSAGPGISATPARLNQARTDVALNSAAGMLRGQNETRGLQQGQLGYLGQLQRGEGPSVGALTAQQGAQKGAGLMQDAGSQAARAMMQSQAQAAGAYGDAAGMQGRMTGRAAFEAGNALRDNADAAVRGQASLAARARGGNIGASLLNAQNNAAASYQRAGIDASRMMTGANMQAADNAAMAMRAAQQGDVQSRLQAAGALERGNINAGMVGSDMMLEGAKIRSGEQLSATGMMNDSLQGMRGADIGAAQAGTGLAGVNLSADNAAGDMSRFNSELGFREQTANQDNRFRYDNLNSGNTLATNSLNAGMERDYSKMNLDSQIRSDDRYTEDDRLRDLANQSAQLSARDMYGREAITYTGMGTGQETENRNSRIRGEEFQAGQQSHGLDRASNYLTGNATIAAQKAAAKEAADSQFWGGMVGAGAGLAGAAILASDERLKKDIKPGDKAMRAMSASFRKAKPYKYKYKNPANGERDGEFVGPMAQDLPREVTTKRPDGKLAVDTGRLALLMSSQLGEQQRRIDKLEGKGR